MAKTIEKCVREEIFLEKLKDICISLNFEIRQEKNYDSSVDKPSRETSSIHRTEKKKIFGIYSGDKRLYSVATLNEYFHEWGQGGHRKELTTLFKITDNEEKAIFDSENYSSWRTYSDDSDDYPAGSHEKTRLLLEDNLSNLLFEIFSNQNISQ